MVLPIVILMTQSRGGFLALALFAVMVMKGQRKKLRAAGALAILGLVVVMASPSGVWERVSSIPDAQDSSALQRRQIWRVAGEIIDDNPITGVGLGAYSYVHQIYANQKVEHAIAGGTRDTHSTYLNVLAETGYPGFALFCLLILAPVITAERARRRSRTHDPEAANQLWYLEASLAAYLAAGVFGTFSHLAFLYLHLGILAVLARIATAPVPVRQRAAASAGQARLRARRRLQPAMASGWTAPAAASRQPIG